MTSSLKIFSNSKSSSDIVNMECKWKTDEDLVIHNKCKYDVQYLGNTEISDPADFRACCATVKELLSKKKMIKSVLKVSIYSLTVFDKNTNDIKVDQTLKSILMASSNPIMPYSFFYITRDNEYDVYQLWGFISMKEVSERIIKSILFALQVYCEKQSELKNSYFKFEKPQQIELDKSFKQTTLVERYQDPQSSIVISKNKIPNSKTIPDLKAIPRPKCQRKNSNTIFPNLNPNDLFKQSPSGTPELNKFENVSNDDLLNIVMPNNIEEDQDDFDQIFHSNGKMQNEINLTADSIPFNKISNFEGIPCPPSKYDIFKNINAPLISKGWSEDIIGIEKSKVAPTNTSSNGFDEFISSFIGNINLRDNKK